MQHLRRQRLSWLADSREATEQPSERAKEHQYAGAKYLAFQRECNSLLNRARHGRIRLDSLDAQVLYLQNKKSELDATSPNAPTWWKNGVIKEMAAKQFNRSSKKIQY